MKIHPLLRPSAVAVHLVVAVLVGIAGWLGWWQVGSWQEQRSDAARARTELDAVPLAEALGPDDPFPKAQVGRPVTVSGTWLPQSTVYIDDRLSSAGDDRGLWAVTPVAVGPEDQADRAPALLVVRGWVADRDSAPDPPTGRTEVVAWLQPAEGSRQPDEDRSDDILPQVRIADAIQHVDQDLYGAFAVVDHDRDDDPRVANPGTDSLLPVTPDELPPVARSTGLRNLLYGIEWWIFGGFAVFLWGRWCRDEVGATRRAVDEDAVAAAASGTDTVES